VEFDGGGFHGFQRQDGARTVQGAIESAWLEWLGETIGARSSSRTDAGVHGRLMPVALRTGADLPTKALVHGLNRVLDEDLGVVQGRWASDAFDVRYDAFGKRYIYRLWVDRVRSPRRRRDHWLVKRPQLDVAAMQRAAGHMLGEHDFAGFRSAHCTAATTRRLLSRVRVSASGPQLTVTIEGNAFLQNMVRILVGTLVQVGHGAIDADELPAVIASLDRTRAGPTAPAHGLTLDEVFFGPDGERWGLDHDRLNDRLAERARLWTATH
jgi:tRNA pseudouridine38-40 synthase